MALTLPIAAVGTTNLDAGTDRPDLARADLLAAVQKLNMLLAELSTSAAAGLIVVRDANGKVVGDITGNAATATAATSATSAGSCSGNAATASLAASATSALALNGKKWVNVVNSSVSMSAGTTQTINLKTALAGHRYYRVSVYAANPTAETSEAYTGYTTYNIRRSNTGYDTLYIQHAADLGTKTIYYQVDAWE